MNRRLSVVLNRTAISLAASGVLGLSVVPVVSAQQAPAAKPATAKPEMKPSRPKKKRVATRWAAIAPTE
jgi:hypothetical protein